MFISLIRTTTSTITITVNNKAAPYRGRLAFNKSPVVRVIVPSTVDKIKEMNFTMKEGTNVSSPYIDECPVSIECKVKTVLQLGTHDCFIAEVVGSHVNKNLFDEKGKIHLEKADLISYCHGEYFKMDTNPLGSFGYSVAKKKKALQSKSVKAKKGTPTAKSKSSKFKKSFNKKGR